MTRVSSREFNRDTGGAKRAARSGSVYITDRGRPSHVLLTFDDYRRLAADRPSIGDLLSEPAGIEDVELALPVDHEVPEPARLE